MSAERLAVLAVLGCLVVAGCGGGDEDEPLRVGVLADCSGILASYEEPIVAAAQFPFLRRGAKPAGRSPLDGIDGARVGGRKVEVLHGCVEAIMYSLLIAETRRLIEEEGVDVIVGPVGDPEAVVVRKLAARYPDVTFLLGYSVSQDPTLRDVQPNLFRFTADAPQTVAGLGTYAYRELGWRTASVLTEDIPAGWDTAAGFVTEFCALGGRVVDRHYLDFFTFEFPPAGQLAREADGVAYLATFHDPSAFLSDYGRHVKRLSQRVVGGGPGYASAGALKTKGVDPSGMVVAYDIPPTSDAPQWQAYVKAFRRTFPGLAPEYAEDTVLFPYTTASEAIAQALERGGDLRKALARVELDAPFGPVRLDANRQAIVTTHLERARRDGSREPLRLIRDVDQGYGGAFTAATPAPTRDEPVCRRGDPPPWSRG